jgi:hypothetical protein
MISGVPLPVGHYMTLEERLGFNRSLYRGIDFVSSFAAGTSLYWVLKMPTDGTYATLVSRVLKARRNGDVSYKVWLLNTPGVGYTEDATPIAIPQAAGGKVLWSRVSDFPDPSSTSVLADADCIPDSGVGNNTAGGAAGGQALRRQPLGVEFIVQATNNNSVAAVVDFQLAIGWFEGPPPHNVEQNP